MIIIDSRSRTPVYEQIKEQVMNMINLGELKPDDKLPSMRQLASELSVNVNTVKKAFSELETERVTYSLPGKGVFISEGAIANRIVHENAEAELIRVLCSSKAKGVSKERIAALINEVYGKGDSE